MKTIPLDDVRRFDLGQNADKPYDATSGFREEDRSTRPFALGVQVIDVRTPDELRPGTVWFD